MGKEKQTGADVEAFRVDKSAKKQSELEAKRKEKRNSIIITICVILVAAFMISIVAYNRMVDSGFFLRSKTAAESENFEVDGAMMTYFYNSNYQTYSQYASYLGIDTSTSLKTQTTSIGTGTWFDYFVGLTKSYVSEVLALCELASANGVTLDDADYASIEESIDSLEQTASAYGYTVNQYLVTAFGAGINTKDIKKCLELTALASKYSQQYTESLSYTDEQLEAYYEENKSDFDGVDVISITVPSSYFTETDADGNPVGDSTAASEAAKAQADAIAAAGSMDEFNEQIRYFLENYVAAEDDDIDAMVAQCYSEHVSAATISDVSDWAFSGSVGDTTVSGEEGASQFIAYYLAKTSYRDETLGRNVRHILFTTDTYEDDSKTSEVYAEWEAAGFTVDKFIELSNDYNEDGGSIDNGGLYENVFPGDMVDEFNDWLFDDARQAGDHGIVETSYGWHIMYYAGEGDGIVWKNEAESELLSADYDALIAANSTSVTFDDDVINTINA